MQLVFLNPKTTFFMSQHNKSTLALYCKNVVSQRGNNLISTVEAFLASKKISQSERETMAETFRAIDKDGSGMIECAEILAIYRQQNEHVTDEEAQRIINSIDKDHSGKIDFN